MEVRVSDSGRGCNEGPRPCEVDGAIHEHFQNWLTSMFVDRRADAEFAAGEMYALLHRYSRPETPKSPMRIGY